MKVRMLTSGHQGESRFNAGDEIEVPERTGKRLIKDGRAEQVEKEGRDGGSR